MSRCLSIIIFSLPLFLTAEIIVVKTKAPQNRNAVFQYRVPRGYDKNRREMYRVLVIFGELQGDMTLHVGMGGDGIALSAVK